VAGQSGGAVQLLDAQQNKSIGGTAGSWFSAAEQPPDSGEIDCHHTLLALVRRIYSRRLTGKLQLVFGRVEKALFFDAGELVFATSSDRQDGLGEVMLRAGALTQSQFEEASTLVETGQRFGSAIAEMGIYGVEEIIGWVQRQVLQITASVLDYPVGRYFFFSSPEKNVVPEIGAPVPLGKLLLAAVRKAGDLPLERLAEDADLEVELSAVRLFKAEDLEHGEQQLLSLISQRASAKQVIAQSGLPKAEASRGLYALLLLGFVAGVPAQVRPEPEPVVPTPPPATEPAKAVEASSATNIAEQQAEEAAVPAPVAPEEATAQESEAPSQENVTHGQPQLEETSSEPDEPKEGEGILATPLPLLKPNAIAREVVLRATGISAEKNGPRRELFHEETTSVLVAETGGVIRSSGAVTAGQLLLLTNVDSKREVTVQVLRKRAYKPTSCYLELEFLEAAPRFWGTEFSAATALLPKNTQDVEAATLVITAEPTADQPWVLPTAPEASEVQRFKREVEELRGRAALTETPPANAEANALAQLRGEVQAASGIPEPGDPLSTQAILESGLDAAGAAAPAKRETDPAQGEAEQPETPQSLSDFLNSLPEKKRWRLVGGGFTPEFNRAVLMVVLLVVVLVAGVAWFKNWRSTKAAEAKVKKLATSESVKVMSDAPVTSAGIPAKSAPASDASAPLAANGSAAPAEAASSAAPAEPLASKEKTSRAKTAAKTPSVRPAAKPAASLEATSAKESAVVIPPKLIHSVPAVASLEAMHDFERGNVVIDAVVGTSGEVHFISVISGPPSLRAPAVESLKEYKYEPATRSGQPVPAHVTITIHFRFEP